MFSRHVAGIPFWIFLEMHSTSPSISRSLALGFYRSTAFQLHHNWKVSILTEQEHWCVQCPQHPFSQPQNIRTWGRAFLNWSRATLYSSPLPPDLGILGCVRVSDTSWAPAWLSSWPGVPARLACRVSDFACLQLCVTSEQVLQCQQLHPLHVSQTRIHQILPPAS